MEQRWGLPLVAWPLRLRPNTWDLVALPLVLGLVALIAWGSLAMSAPLSPGPAAADQPRPVAACRNTRCARCCAWAGRWSPRWSSASPMRRSPPRAGSAEKLLIPLLDILQSVPILGFLSITVTGFIALFPGPAARRRMRRDLRDLHLAGLEHDVQRLPVAAHRAARTDRSGAHVPPVAVAAVLAARSAARDAALVWNMMMSVSGGWFFVVASEAITVAGQHDPAARHRLLHRGGHRAARTSARSAGPSLVMFVVILLYDQLLFRPLLAWSQQIPGRSVGRRRERSDRGS